MSWAFWLRPARRGLGRTAGRSRRAARGSPGRTAERSLRHPGFAHSCILAFALQAALECKAGLSGPGLPLARRIEVRLACSGPGSPSLERVGEGARCPSGCARMRVAGQLRLLIITHKFISWRGSAGRRTLAERQGLSWPATSLFTACRAAHPRSGRSISYDSLAAGGGGFPAVKNPGFLTGRLSLRRPRWLRRRTASR
jgi:hypothetical protein